MKKHYLFLFLLFLGLSGKSFAQPTTAATTPPARSAAYVISLLCPTYDAQSGVAGINWFPGWGQQTAAGISTIAGVSTYGMTNLNYEGIQLAANLNVYGMDSVHLDVYSTNCTSLLLGLINTPPVVQNFYTIPITNSGWNSIDIPLSYFATAGTAGGAVNLSILNQLSFTANTPASGANVYVQNLYFYKHFNASAPTLSNFNIPAKLTTSPTFAITQPTSNSSGAFSYTSSNTKVATVSGSNITITGGGSTIITATQAAAGAFSTGTIAATLTVTYPPPSFPAPTPPARSPGSVISLLGNAYKNIGVGTWEWFGGATTYDSLGVAGVPTINYNNVDYVGLGSNNASTALADFSKMTYVHVDIYSPNDTTVSLYMINTVTSPTKQNSVDLPLKSHTGWNSFDIPITGYTTAANSADAGANVGLGLNDFQTLSQIMFANNNPAGSAVIYVENLYFYTGQSTWTGATSNNWSTASNWKENAVPATTNDIIIPFTGIVNQPTISGSITQSGIINDSATINVTSGTVTIGSGGSLIIAPSGALNISGGTLNLGGNSVTLQSSATGSAKVSAITGTLSNATNVTIQRYIGSNAQWRMVGFPLSASTSIAASALSSFYGTGYNAYTFNESADNGNYGSSGSVNAGWVNFTSGSVTADKGILLIGGTPASIINFTGTLNQGTQSIALSYSGSNSNKGWNFISNPFAANLNWTSVIGHNSSGLDNAIYRYDPNTTAYATYVNGSSTGNQSNILENGAGFFVHSTGSTTLTVMETDKTSSAPVASLMGAGFEQGNVTTTDGSVFNTTSQSIIKLALSKEGETAADEVVVRWGAAIDATDLFNGKYDAYDMGRSVGADLSVLGKDGTVYSIFHGSELKNNSEENRTVQLGIKNMNEGNYQLNLQLLAALANNNQAYLLDKYTNEYTLIDNNKYSFTVNADAQSQSVTRFSVVLNYKKAEILNNNLPVSLLTNPSSGNVYVLYSNNNYNNLQWQISDNNGRVLQTGTLSAVTLGNTYTINAGNSAQGIYYILLNGDGKTLPTLKAIKN